VVARVMMPADGGLPHVSLASCGGHRPISGCSAERLSDGKAARYGGMVTHFTVAETRTAK
jgi:hypothetical protein